MQQLIPDTTHLIFIGIGYLIMVASWSWLIHIAFKESAKEGLLFVFVPLYAVYYIVTHWQKTKVTVLIHVIGSFILFISL